VRKKEGEGKGQTGAEIERVGLARRQSHEGSGEADTEEDLGGRD
jgi:hypothetical protein